MCVRHPSQVENISLLFNLFKRNSAIFHSGCKNSVILHDQASAVIQHGVSPVFHGLIRRLYNSPERTQNFVSITKSVNIDLISCVPYALYWSTKDFEKSLSRRRLLEQIELWCVTNIYLLPVVVISLQPIFTNIFGCDDWHTASLLWWIIRK